MNALIVGASSGLGRALAVALARRGYGLFLVSSDERDLDPLARDLALRFDVPVRFRAIDLRRLNADELRRAYRNAFAQLHALFVVAGMSDPDRDCGPEPCDLVDRLIAVNFSAPVHIVNAFLGDLEATPGANCVGIGSVAAARGRRINAVYGACKRGLMHQWAPLFVVAALALFPFCLLSPARPLAIFLAAAYLYNVAVDDVFAGYSAQRYEDVFVLLPVMLACLGAHFATTMLAGRSRSELPTPLASETHD